MSLNKQQVHELRSRGHHLKPVVTIGNQGLTEAVVREMDLSLTHHELMKIKLNYGEREDRAELVTAICARLGAEPIQSVGRTLLLYRPKPQPNSE